MDPRYLMFLFLFFCNNIEQTNDTRKSKREENDKGAQLEERGDEMK